MSRLPNVALALPVAVAVLGLSTCTQSLPDPIVVAEDARPADGPLLQVLLDAARSPDEDQRRRGVRALGRLGREDLLEVVQVGLEDVRPEVRRAAAAAVGQTMRRSVDGSAAAELLRARIGLERDASVIGALAETLGRLMYPDSGAVIQTADVLSEVVAAAEGQPGRDTVLLGAALGYEALVRHHSQSVSPILVERHATILRGLGDFQREQGGITAARIRTLATMALGFISKLEGEALDRALSDPDAAVRQSALLFGQDNLPPALLGLVLETALSDSDARVRVEGVRLLERGDHPSAATCALVRGAAADASVHVRLVALGAMARACPDAAGAVTQLIDIAEGLPVSGQEWHDATFATVALSSFVEADRVPQGSLATARAAVAALTRHENPFVRAHSARALANMGDVASLLELAADSSANVRTAALQALDGMDAPVPDALLLAQLALDDPQLLLTTAGLLTGSENPGLFLAAALATLERISASDRETWRDARSDLLRFIGGAASVADEESIHPYLNDFDPLIATHAAEILTRLTGEAARATPRLLPPEPVPTAADLEALGRTEVVLEMVRGGEIRVALDPDLAPTNAARFARLAAAGDFDGRTLHRVVPNFVVQGGSAGANEYVGEDRFSRDEVGLQPHWRGTVGLSTRGWDTGDGQFYFNLVDNVRLNHDYTVFGTVVSGMDVVDQIREGDVIRSARTETASVNSGG